MQEGMLFSSLATEGGGFDIEQMVWRIRGEVDPNRLRAVLDEVARRHPVLRTAFRWQGLDVPLQDVYEGVLMPFEFKDLSEHPLTVAEAMLEEFLAADRARGFDLAAPPLARVTLFRLQHLEYVFVWTLHHAIVDGRSMTLLSKEVLEIYAAHESGGRLALAFPRPFSEFVRWQRSHLLQNRQSAEEYWRETLQGFPAPTPLPGMHSGSQEAEAYAVSSCERTLPTGTTASLRRLAERHRVTLNTMLQAAWALVLSRHCSRNEVMFGVTRACRHSTVDGSESMVGMFINTVPMRISVPEELTIREWLSGIREMNVRVRAFEHAPLHEIRSWAGLNSAERLFGSILVFENHQQEEVLEHRIAGSPIEVRLLEKTHFPLTLAVYAGERLRICLEYHARSCGDAAALRILREVETVLEGLVLFPDGTVADLPYMPREDVSTVLNTWNETEDSNIATDIQVHRLIEQQAARVPRKIAVEDGVRKVTYEELDAHADQIAAQLRTRGVLPGHLVGLFVERSVLAVEGILGVMKAGCAYVPLDVSYPAERLAFMIENSGLHAILSTRVLSQRLPQTQAVHILMDDWKRASGKVLGAETGGAPKDLAYVIYTSGSTGEPKGVMIEHSSLANYIQATGKLYDITENDRYLQFAPLSFDASVEELFLPLCTGGTVVLRNDLMITSMRRFLTACEEMSVTVLDLPTSFWHQLVVALDQGNLRVPATVRLVAVGGDRMMPQRVVTVETPGRTARQAGQLLRTDRNYGGGHGL